MINGNLAQQGRVQNLFHSVQLNVNNPHFLIMQGRITKVLNMKPIEILGMSARRAPTGSDGRTRAHLGLRAESEARSAWSRAASSCASDGGPVKQWLLAQWRALLTCEAVASHSVEGASRL